jgi:pilus assembly protein Flp/PilA
MLRRFLQNECGATTIEYGLIAALIFLACLTAFYAFGDSATGMFSYISNSITTATTHSS